MAEELISYQEEAYKEIVGEYYFECSHAVADTVKSVKVKTLKKGIKLHLFRYGLVETKSAHDTAFDYESTIGTQNPDGTTTKKDKFTVEEVTVSNSELPELDNFYCARTFLRPGYIYIINKDNNNEYKEYQVNESGKLTGIIWYRGNNGDVRKPNGNTHSFITIPKPGTYYIAYSPVQWSRAYFDEINGSDEKKEAHMQLIDCSGIEIGNPPEGDEIASYRDVKIVSYKQHPQRGEVRTNLREIHADETKESEEGDNDFYEDMFVALHDPIGCAEDVTYALGVSFVEQQAIIQALQTGEDYDTVLARLHAGEEKTNLTDEEEQIYALFQTALTTYQLIYNDDKMIGDYDGGKIGWGGGVYKPKLLNILGVEYRKEHRRKIRSIQDDLGYIMNSPYYRDGWCHYNQGVDDYTLDGKYIATNHMRLLAQKPHDADRHLDLKSEYEDAVKKWEGFFADTLDPDTDELTTLLDTPVEIAFLTGPMIDIENKLGGVIRALTESYATLKIDKVFMVERTRSVPVMKTREVVTYKTVTVQSYEDVMFRRLRAHKVYGEEVLDVQTKEVDAHFKGSSFELDQSRVVYVKYRGGKPIARFQVSKEVVLKQKLRAENKIQLPVKKTEIVPEVKVEQYLDEIEQKFTVPENRQVNKYSNAELAQKLFDGKIFTGSLALLQVFNAMNAYNAIGNKEDYKNIVNSIGITAELTEASLHFRRSILLSRGVSQRAITRGLASRALPYVSNLGAGITVLMCSWEVFDSYNARDYDAMWAWTGAGAAWGVFAFGGTTFSGGIAVAGLGFTPFGLLIAGVALGLTALAYYLKDTPLEVLFKNNVLSDEVDFPLVGDEKPWEYSRRLYVGRDALIPPPTSTFFRADVYRKWTDFKAAYQDLLDVLVCAHIHFTPTKLVHKNTIRPWSSTVSVTITQSDITGYKAEISLRQFLTREEQLEYEVYYFENGLDTSPQRIGIKSEQISIEKIPGKIPKAIIDFEVNQSELVNNNTNSHIVFVCRLELEMEQYYPIDIANKPRYIGAKYTTLEEVRDIKKGLFNTKTIKDSDFQAPVKIDTLANLLSKEAWKK